MADQHDTPNRRLLFTGLDVGDKGRPAASTASTTAFAPLTSLADLAAELGLDFEDDQDGSDFSAAPAASAPATAPAPARTAAFDDDEELDLLADRLAVRDIHEPAIPDHTPGTAAPTWEEFARAFQSAPTEDDDAQFNARRWRGRRRPGATRTGVDADAYDDADDPLLEEDVDILSAIDPDAWQNDDAADDFDDEEEDDATWGDADLAGDDAPTAEDSEADNPAATQVIHLRERLDATELAVAESEADAANPPEDITSDPETGAAAGAATAEPEPELGPRDTIYDMFSDVDIDTLWQEQLEKKERRKRETAFGGKGDSRVMDIFEDVDLDAAWEERKARPRKSDTVRLEELGKGETLILDPGALDAQNTMIIDAAAITRLPPPKPRPETTASGRLKGMPESEDEAMAALTEGLAEAEAAGPRASSRRLAVQPEDVTDDEAFGDLQSILDGEEEAAAPNASAAASDAPAEADPTVALDDPAPDDGFTPGVEAATITTDDVINDVRLDDDDINDTVSAPVIDDSAISTVRGPRPGTEEMQAIMGEYEGDGEDPDAAGEGGAAGGEGDEAGEPEEAVAVDPMDVFANMDDMDFSDDMDDEMRAMMEEDEAGEAGDEAGDGEAGMAAPVVDTPPDGKVARVLWHAGKLLERYMPERALKLLERLQGMIAWRENWWFYCDLLAAIIASASLAVILSYYIWYRK